MPFVADWGEEGKVIEVTTEDFQKYSLQLFGYDYTHPQMQMFREIFKNAKVLYGYRLNSGTTKAKKRLCCDKIRRQQRKCHYHCHRK